MLKTTRTRAYTDLSGLVAEIFDSESDDGRRSVVGICSPRQSNTRLRHILHVRLGGRSRERRRLWSPVEDDAWIGRSFDDEESVPRGLASLTGRFTRVQTRVRLA